MRDFKLTRREFVKGCGSAAIVTHAVESKLGAKAKGTCGGCITEEEFGASNDFWFDVHSDSCTAPTAR